MARKPRMYLPGMPVRVVHRGNNRAACFFTDEVYRLYLERLQEGDQLRGTPLVLLRLACAGKGELLITDHPLYEALGKAANERRQAYRELFRHRLPDIDIHQIRERLSHNYPLGNERFREGIETMLRRHVSENRRGRRFGER